MVDAAAAATATVGTVATIQLITATVPDGTAVAAAAGLTRQRYAASRYAHAIRASFSRRASATIYCVTATITNLSAEFGVTGLTGTRRRAIGTAHAHIVLTVPTRLRAIAAVERPVATIADLSTVLTSGRITCRRSGAILAGIATRRRIRLHIKLRVIAGPGLSSASGSSSPSSICRDAGRRRRALADAIYTAANGDRKRERRGQPG